MLRPKPIEYEPTSINAKKTTQKFFDFSKLQGCITFDKALMGKLEQDTQ